MTEQRKPTNWVIQRIGARWSAEFTDGRMGFHHKFDTFEEALEQATWNWTQFDTLRIVDEMGLPIAPGQWLKRFRSVGGSDD
ncbi:hypothetical protein [Mycolicibacterium austroafricanum]|uniref:hypothetical protein n=1 Tax=Mycolicibacterium austroafricanum TaxID=39687 RepID=UPI001CA345C3|nr:hypothetical protein [Mycolicibacterium austroafricanum]QZT61264.1 hypothetical protein JN085_20060 [Mycolicibacterium austroafricanum]